MGSEAVSATRAPGRLRVLEAQGLPPVLSSVLGSVWFHAVPKSGPLSLRWFTERTSALEDELLGHGDTCVVIMEGPSPRPAPLSLRACPAA